MSIHDDNELSDLLGKYYKPDTETDLNKTWESVSKKINSLFHEEILSDIDIREDGLKYTIEEKYWLGIDEYINNKVNSFKHRIITEHLLKCKECRKNYNDSLDKKKVVVSL